MKRLKRQATVENITNKDVVQAFMLDLEKNYNVYSFADKQNLWMDEENPVHQKAYNMAWGKDS